MPIQAGPDGGAAEREFLQRVDRLFGPSFSEPDLLRVAAKLLSEPNGCRIHQMGSPDLDDVVEFLSLFPQARRPVFRARE